MYFGRPQEPQVGFALLAKFSDPDRAHAAFADSVEQLVPSGDDLARDELAKLAGRRTTRDGGGRSVRSVFPGDQLRGWTRFRDVRPGRAQGRGCPGFGRAGEVGFQEPAGPVVGDEQGLDTPTAGGVALIDAALDRRGFVRLKGLAPTRSTFSHVR